MKIIWVAHPSECEFDIVESCRQSGIELVLYQVAPYVLSMEEGKHEGPSAGKFYGKEAQHSLLLKLKDETADLIVFRYPYWIGDEWLSEIHAIENRVPTITWCSEQGPTIQEAINAARRFHNIAVDNYQDILAYKAACPDNNVIYLPSGCARWSDKLIAKPEYSGRRIVTDGSAHYACFEKCAGDSKRISVETMALPLKDYSVSIYGSADPVHGWGGVSQLQHSFRGFYHPAEYPHVYASHELYVGITWNWRYGGFGIKLGRALASGIPVIWHRTVGTDLEGLVEGTHLEFSSSPAETKEKVDYYLEHPEARKRLGDVGQAWAYENWDWAMCLSRIAGALKK